MESESDAPQLQQSDIPQSEPLDENQIRNNAGGYVYKIDDFSRLRRFIILGSNGNNYYVSEQQLGLENCECVLQLLAEGEGLRVVEEVTRISTRGRAPRQSTGILVLAVCARLGDLATRRAALAALPAVCRTASTLFEFVQYCKDLGPATRATRVGDTAATPSEVRAWLDAQKAAATAAEAAAKAAAAAAKAAAKAAVEEAEEDEAAAMRALDKAYAAAKAADADHVDEANRAHDKAAEAANNATKALSLVRRTVHVGMRCGGTSSTATPLAGKDAAARDSKASWGRSMRRAIARWYLDKSPAAVAYQATKYSQRHGWGHADVLRLAHPDPEKYAAKKQKVILEAKEKEKEKEKEEKEGEKEKEGADTDAGAGDVASTLDSDWVMVPEETAEGAQATEEAGVDNAGTSELRSLEAAMAATGLAAVEADTNEAAAAAAAQHVADMKAIFDFLTHGTVPGQERPERRAKRLRGDAAATGGETGAAKREAAAVVAVTAATAATAATAGSATEGAAEGGVADSMQVDSGAVAVAATYPSTAAADDTIMTTDEDAPKPPQAAINTQTSVAPLAPATVVGESAGTHAAAAADTAAAPAVPLSPVMQYLVDAHRLRKEIRAPPPLIKPTTPSTSPQRVQLSGRGRARGRRVAVNEEPKKEQPARPPPDPAALAANEAERAKAVALAVSLVRRHRFGHEHVGDTGLLRAPELWAAFLEVGMPLTALLRNLGRMTGLGVLQRPDCLSAIIRRLSDGGALSVARVHPMTILEALCTYKEGAGARGVARWVPEKAVLEALDAAFYLAFKNVVPTGQRYLLGLDVSGSMSWACAGMTSVSSREAAATVLMMLVRTEPWVKALAFSHQLVPFEVQPSEKLDEVVQRSEDIQMGGTDCALPIVHATEHKIPVDVFVILTDNETWFGGIHPAEALRQYRRKMDLPHAKLVVLAFSASQFSIADPNDPGMLDVAGLDSAVPQLMADFVTGKL
ncbi:hypothetical protein VaNZ11_009814 [Volvox africanus]|uniref:TROVE domain-containing protein n=1 Tax=Volvox africanus TaxID=51714 RepID=A0ABQ5S852_9CHLO|nr:hypothetical protein VaNZ11_009814 [Volvox africanus]